MAQPHQSSGAGYPPGVALNGRGRRIEIKPVGTIGDPKARAVLIDEYGIELCELPTRYERASGGVRYVVIDLAPEQPPLWGGS